MGDPTKQIFAIVDVNNMYVSCERAFNPRLRDRPVVMVSNNDGCAVARSNEVKVLGVPMGAPWFQMRDLTRQHGIVGLSSNYTLSADMSNHIMTTRGDAISEGLHALEARADALLAKLQPAQRRAINHKVATDLRSRGRTARPNLRASGTRS